MACNNFMTKQNNQSYKSQKIQTNIHFNNVFKKSLDQDKQYKIIKFR